MTVTELCQGIGKYVDAYQSGDTGALARCLGFLTAGANIRELLNGIVDDKGLLGEVAEQSVWHPNGFAKIVLAAQPHYRLRLHVWRRPNASRFEAQENIHNHRWDFCTVILSGHYRHQEFRSGVQGAQFYGYLYHKLTAHADGYQLLPTGAHSLGCVFDAFLSAGTQYTMSSEVLHRVIPDPRAPAVSLVLEGPHQERSVQVFSPIELTPSPHATQFGRISRGFVTRCLRDTLLLPGLQH